MTDHTPKTPSVQGFRIAARHRLPHAAPAPWFPTRSYRHILVMRSSKTVSLRLFSVNKKRLPLNGMMSERR